MKRFLSAVFFFMMSVFSFAHGGLMATSGDIKFIQTKWFDIIYPEKSRESAQRIAAICDETYEKLCKEFSSPKLEEQNIGEPQFRMTVVITPNTDLFNAYYSNYTFNHIVLLDSVPDESMAVFSSTLENTFIHELTHTVSFNTTTSGVRNIMKIFGDTFNIGGALVPTTFISEGATVAQESKGGEGRLNDGFYLHTVREAKALDCFPDYSDVTGSRDIFPGGNMSYAFGGPFAKYLQDTYGMQKYAEFWAECISHIHVSYRGAFKDAYGFKIDKAWKDFIESVEVPDVKKSVLDEDGVSDFLRDTESSVKNFRGHLFSNVSVCDTGIYFLDESTSSVWFAKKTDGSFKKAKKVFTKSNISCVRASRDGAFLAVSFYDINHIALKSKVAVYNVKTNSFYEVSETGLRDAAVIKKDGAYFLAAIKTLSQNASVDFFTLDKKGRAEFFEKCPLAKESIAFSPCDAGSGSLAFVLKEGLKWSICILDDVSNPLESGIVKIATPGEDLRIRNLSLDAAGKKLTFCFAKKDTFPRYGELLLEEGSQKYLLEDSDKNGGVYFPVDAGCGNIIYCANTVTSLNLVSMKNNPALLKDFPLKKEDTSFTALGEERVLQNLQPGTFSLEEKSYKKPYNLRGFLLPFASAVPLTIENSGRTSQITEQPASFIGATYTMGNAWDSDYVSVSAGLDVLDSIGGATLRFFGNANTSVYSYDNQTGIFFYDGGFLQCTNIFNFASAFSVERYSSFTFSEYNAFFYGKLYETDDENAEYFSSPIILFDAYHWYDENIVSAEFSTIHKTGSGTFETGGIAFSANYQTVVCGVKDDSKPNVYDSNSSADYLFRDKKFYHNLFPRLVIKLPALIPIECAYGYTYNFPLSITTSLVPSYSTFYSARASVVLFAKEVQKGASFMPLFLNRFYINGGFSYRVKNDNDSFEILKVADDFKDFSSMKKEPKVFAGVNFSFTYNSGMACNIIHNLGIECGYNIKDSAFSLSLIYNMGL